MHASDERARGGWMEKQLEAELLRVGGPVALRAAQAEARESAARRRAEILFGADRAGSVRPAAQRYDHLLDEELYARLDVLARRVDLTRRDPARADVAARSTPPGPAEHVVRSSVPADAVEPEVASVARVYDFALGGTNNYEVDRRAGYEIAAALPEARHLARDCRAFVARVVTWLVAHAGIDQIIDIGSGLPTAGNVHEIAAGHRDRTRVVYVDNDPVVVAHGRTLLGTARESTAIVHADLRDAASIFGHPETERLIDTGRPFAVLASCVLHHLPDDADPPALLEAVKAFLTPGSYLAVANFVATPGEPRVAEIEHGFLTSGLGSGRFRPVAEHERYFTGLDLVPPGLVYANDWHPGPETARSSPVHRLHLAGVGRKVSDSRAGGRDRPGAAEHRGHTIFRK